MTALTRTTPTERPTWADLHSRIDATQAAWDAASAGLDGREAAGGWSALQLHSHVAAALLRYADTLARVAVSRAAEAAPASEFLPGRHPYPRVRQLGEKGWRDFRGSARTVAKQPDRGAAISTADEPGRCADVRHGCARAPQRARESDATRGGRRERVYSATGLVARGAPRWRWN